MRRSEEGEEGEEGGGDEREPRGIRSKNTGSGIRFASNVVSKSHQAGPLSISSV